METRKLVRLVYKLLCRMRICLGGVVCQDGKATCSTCGYCDHYGKRHNAKVSGGGAFPPSA